MQEVQVYACVYGDYCAFHEMGVGVVYDVTNDIQMDDLSLEELEDFEYDGDIDYAKFNAVKVGDTYYIDFNS